MPTAPPRRHAGHHQPRRQTASGRTSPRQAPATRTHHTSQAPQTPGQANRRPDIAAAAGRANSTSQRPAHRAHCCRYPGEQLCWAACCARTADRACMASCSLSGPDRSDQSLGVGFGSACAAWPGTLMLPVSSMAVPWRDSCRGLVGPRGRDPAAVGHDRLQAWRGCHPGCGVGGPAVYAQLAACGHEDDITCGEISGCAVEGDGEFPVEQEQHLFSGGRWAAPVRPAGTLSCQAQSWVLPRDGATNELNVLPCTWCTAMSAERMTGTNPPGGQAI